MNDKVKLNNNIVRCWSPPSFALKSVVSPFAIDWTHKYWTKMNVFGTLFKNINQYRLKKCLRNIFIQSQLSINYFCHGWSDKPPASLASPRGRPELLQLQLRRPLVQLLLLVPVRVRGSTATTASLATVETCQQTTLFTNCGKQSTGAENFLRWSTGNDSTELCPTCKWVVKKSKACSHMWHFLMHLQFGLITLNCY